MQNLEWFHQLNKPFLTPPDWIFAPMWILLYITIAISFVLYVNNGDLKNKKIGIGIFILQMLLNLSWSPAFFNMQNIALALIIILFLWLFILLTIITFYKHSKVAVYILLPYFIWVSFAVYLNFGYFVLN